jgi:hypothetical protein
MLTALVAEGVEFLVVGGYAVIAHGSDRTTGDIDFLIRASPENAARVWRALKQFGAPLRGVTEHDFAQAGVVYQIGVRPNRIDILTEISGVDFDEAWAHRLPVQLDGLVLPVLGLTDLLASKRASGRRRDLADVRTLEGLAGRNPQRTSGARNPPRARTRRGKTGGR